MKLINKILAICLLFFANGEISFAESQGVKGSLTDCATGVYIVAVNMGVPADGYNHFQIAYNKNPYADRNTVYIESNQQVDSSAGKAMFEQAINALDMGLKVNISDDIDNCKKFDALYAWIPSPSQS